MEWVLSYISEVFYLIFKMNVWGHFSYYSAFISVEALHTRCIHHLPAQTASWMSTQLSWNADSALWVAAYFWLCRIGNSRAHEAVKLTAPTVFFKQLFWYWFFNMVLYWIMVEFKYHIFSHSKYTIQCFFRIFTELCIHHHSLILQNFCQSLKETLYSLAVTSNYPYPQP